MGQPLGICKLCLEEKYLHRSHILSEFLYDAFYDDQHRMVKVELSNPYDTRPRTGLWEYMLCKACEDLLGAYETSFKTSWYTEGKQPKLTLPIHVINGLKYREFKLCMLSFLWRASVSIEAPGFSTVQLGVHHDERLRKMILNGDPGEELDYPFLCTAVFNRDDKTIVEAISEPVPLKSKEGHRTYEFQFGGCSWVYFVSQHSLRKLFQLEKWYLTKEGTLPAIVKYLDEHQPSLAFSKALKRRPMR